MRIKFLQLWYGLWLRVAYLLNLRKITCAFMRWWKGENKIEKTTIPTFPNPEAMQKYLMSRFEYRKDQILLKIGGIRWLFPTDWVTHQEVFETRLRSKTVPDGDCDDAHFWGAHALLSVPGVEAVYLMSSGFRGGAHATTVFKHNGKWRHLDYRLYSLADPNDAPMEVSKRYTKEGKPVEVTFWNFERVTKDSWHADAVCPVRLPA
jgi:hypothetical protein